MVNPTELMQSILKSREAQYLIDYLSPIYGEARVFLWLFQAIGIALDEAESVKDDFDTQSQVAKATWSIPLYEEQYGLIKNGDLSDEQRRTNIYAAIRFKVPLNPRKVEMILSAIGQTSVSIIENTGPNTFTVVSGNSPYLDDMLDFLDTAKPAHTIYKYGVADDIEADQTVYGWFNAVTVPVTEVDFGGVT